ncbi:unnamed protein product, partial [Acanthoscelides obtectus]
DQLDFPKPLVQGCDGLRYLFLLQHSISLSSVLYESSAIIVSKYYRGQRMQRTTISDRDPEEQCQTRYNKEDTPSEL